MSWLRSAGSFARQLSRSLDPRHDYEPQACYSSFCRHWQQAREIIARSQPQHLHDDVLGVVNHLEQLTTLLVLEARAREITSATSPAACLEHLLAENLLDKLYEWGTCTGKYENAVRLEELKLFGSLVSHYSSQVIAAEPFLRPLLKLLSGFRNELPPPHLESQLVIVLNQICVALMQNMKFIDLFFLTTHTQNGSQAEFILVRLLLSSVHREGGAGAAARDALLLCANMSARCQPLADCMARGNTCVVLATGLSGLYSLLPRTLGERVYRLTPDDVNRVHKLALFIDSLEFCNAVAQVHCRCERADSLLPRTLGERVYRRREPREQARALHRLARVLQRRGTGVSGLTRCCRARWASACTDDVNRVNKLALFIDSLEFCNAVAQVHCRRERAASLLPRTLGERVYRLTPDDVNRVHKLALFIDSLEFCNAVAQVHCRCERADSLLPRTLGERVYRLTPDDVNRVHKLALFIDSLEFCNAVAQVAHPSIKRQLLDLLYHGFLVPVLGPALLQSGAPEQAAAMAYLELVLRCSTAGGLLRAVLRFLIAHEYDGVKVLDVLLARLHGDSQLSLVSLSLMETLIDLNCEDVMIELVFKYLLNGHHLMVNHRHLIAEAEPYRDAAVAFLGLSPRCCSRPLAKTKQWVEEMALSGRRLLDFKRGDEDKRMNGMHGDIAMNNLVQEVKFNYGNPNDTLFGNYHAYLCDARFEIVTRVIACASWSSRYDRVCAPATETNNNDNKQIPDTHAKEQDSLISLWTGGYDTQKTSDSSEKEQLSLTSLNETVDADKTNDALEGNGKEHDSLTSIGESSGYDSFRYKAEEGEEGEGFAEESFRRSFSKGATERARHYHSELPARSWRAQPETIIGPLLSSLLKKAASLLEAELAVNWRVTGALSKLMSLPAPLLTSLLCPGHLLQPNVPSLYQILSKLKEEVDELTAGLENIAELVDKARVFLIQREMALANPRAHAEEARDGARQPQSARGGRSVIPLGGLDHIAELVDKARVFLIQREMALANPRAHAEEARDGARQPQSARGGRSVIPLGGLDHIAELVDKARVFLIQREMALANPRAHAEEARDGARQPQSARGGRSVIPLGGLDHIAELVDKARVFLIQREMALANPRAHAEEARDGARQPQSARGGRSVIPLGGLDHIAELVDKARVFLIQREMALANPRAHAEEARDGARQPQSARGGRSVIPLGGLDHIAELVDKARVFLIQREMALANPRAHAEEARDGARQPQSARGGRSVIPLGGLDHIAELVDKARVFLIQREMALANPRAHAEEARDGARQPQSARGGRSVIPLGGLDHIAELVDKARVFSSSARWRSPTPERTRRKVSDTSRWLGPHRRAGGQGARVPHPARDGARQPQSARGGRSVIPLGGLDHIAELVDKARVFLIQREMALANPRAHAEEARDGARQPQSARGGRSVIPLGGLDHIAELVDKARVFLIQREMALANPRAHAEEGVSQRAGAGAEQPPRRADTKRRTLSSSLSHMFARRPSASSPSPQTVQLSTQNAVYHNTGPQKRLVFTEEAYWNQSITLRSILNAVILDEWVKELAAICEEHALRLSADNYEDDTYLRTVAL
ncbi:retinoic acid induced 16-like protein domain-containing protein [Phthorimaea operculella]|nr:retinoic acid induced 16-like protein domain-containing protein [Phthorimaea operculella]